MHEKALATVQVIGITLMVAFLAICLGCDDPLLKRDRLAQISSQERILKDGDKLLERGLYMQALAKYELALDQKFIAKDEDIRGPIVRKIRYYRITGNFRAGLAECNKAPAVLKLDPELKIELEALQNSRESLTSQSVFDYIGHLKQKYQNSLPPKAYNAFSSIAIGQKLRLYNTIGDHDAGIAYIDETLAFLKERRKAKGDPLYILYNLKNSQAAMECMNRPKPNPDYRGCKLVREYLLIREAFEQDKAEGFKGCLDAKPRHKEGGQAGEVCMGRATKALIESDYFPW